MYIKQHACTEACNIHFTELKLALSRKHISMPVFFLAFQDPNSAPEYQQVMTFHHVCIHRREEELHHCTDVSFARDWKGESGKCIWQ